ncbi:flavin reductase family protein [Virgibacillus soli]|uniref:Flavin reductase family protein n=1 Tax=Paracerasibacillus soli TaxID=480284 RepID=A0ABU5CRJ9_9BACI|nr:flavin reductase family protein [Virgibacillus soli]MDY0408961.1 flavin reductase family protein [Virgibacillus soli]
MDDQRFRKAMGKFATGVTIVTTKTGEDIHGMTANAFMSVSLNPKLVLISIDEDANMNRYIQDEKRFAVSILHEKQKYLSAYFAGQVKERKTIAFANFLEMPVIKEALVTLVCDVADTIVAGDHTLFLGKVQDLAINDGLPLTFFDGDYQQFATDIKLDG